MYGNSNYLCKVPEISTSMECKKRTVLTKNRFGGPIRKMFFTDDRLSGNAFHVKISVSRIIQENKEKKNYACFASSSKEDVSACESRTS